MKITNEVLSQIDKEMSKIDFGYDCSYRDIEELEIVVDGVKYGLIEHDDTGVEDEGKYQYGAYIMELCVEPEEKGVLTSVYYKVDWSRSGSYYTYYCYSYEAPIRVEKVKEVIEIENWVSV